MTSATYKANSAFDNFDRYQEETTKLAIYPKEMGLAYTALGLTGESGEVADKVKKIYRDSGGFVDDDTRWSLIKELGDVLWYVSQAAEELNCDLSVIAELNLLKLWSRKANNTITGDGDNR